MNDKDAALQAELLEKMKQMPLTGQTPYAAGANGHTWSPDMVQFLTIATFAFMALTLILCTILLWRRNATGPQILRVFGIITIIGLSALLLFVGYSNEQLTPIVGLFGAIAGYLLGKDSNSAKPGEPGA